MTNSSSSAIVPVPFTSGYASGKGISRKNEITSPFSAVDRELLRKELERTLVYFTECDFPCVLEGFGIIFPIEHKVQQVTTEGRNFFLSVVNERSVDFEKTDEIYQSHRLQFPKLLDERDISDHIFEKIQLKLSIHCTEGEVRKALKKIIAGIREETIEHGCCEMLPALGTFVAHHNRQGNTPRDWYAGSDIFLDKPWSKILKLESSSKLQAPILINAHEPFEMMYGTPLAVKKYNPSTELAALGYEIPDHLKDSFSISVAAFTNNSAKGKKVVSFVTDGLRRLAGTLGSSIGSEIVIQMPIAEIDSVSFDGNYQVDISRYPLFLDQIFALITLLISCSKNGQIPRQVAVEFESQYKGFNFGDLTSLVAFPFPKLGQQQHTEDGNFYYSALTFITSDEANYIQNNQKYVLSLFLGRKGYDQVLSVKRRSVCLRTTAIKR